jgi:hypothetical protein
MDFLVDLATDVPMPGPYFMVIPGIGIAGIRDTSFTPINPLDDFPRSAVVRRSADARTGCNGSAV